ncbi:MAG: DUF1501 domain-containing protein [Planctomycetaceae bacterium]|nr:DUF1501 domain-containing protein [Planctomycetaceae bacterium]
MLRINLGNTKPYCDGLSRRNFVQLGMAGMGTLGMADLLRAKEQSASKKDTSVILIWLDGGPGHMDMYDMKPDAPSEYRGIWSPIKTNVPGMEITELFPKQAKVADKFSIIRSLYHNTGDHFTGGHFMLTGRGGVSGADNRGRYPFVGAIATKMTGPRRSGMPAHAAVPYGMSIGLRPGYFGGNYLGNEYNPFETEGDPNSPKFQVRNLGSIKDLTLDRLQDRHTLLKDFDQLRHGFDVGSASVAVDRFQTQAYDMVTSPAAAKAFDLSSEDPKVRDMYGRTPWGQSTLLARRLVEAGTTWVSVHLGGWDHHWDLEKGMNRYLPQVDDLVSGLFTDLTERGLYDKTLVVLCGEFSRTPKMNDGGNGGPPGSMGQPGRDHWGNSMFTLVGGGGIKGGTIVGSTTRLGDSPKDRPLTPSDLHTTIFHVLGVDPHVKFLDHAGRPTPAIDKGDVIRELLV